MTPAVLILLAFFTKSMACCKYSTHLFRSSSVLHSTLMDLTPSTVDGPIIVKQTSGRGTNIKSQIPPRIKKILDLLKASVPSLPLIISLIREVSITYLGLGGIFESSFLAEIF